MSWLSAKLGLNSGEPNCTDLLNCQLEQRSSRFQIARAIVCATFAGAKGTMGGASSVVIQKFSQASSCEARRLRFYLQPEIAMATVYFVLELLFREDFWRVHYSFCSAPGRLFTLLSRERKATIFACLIFNREYEFRFSFVSISVYSWFFQYLVITSFDFAEAGVSLR